MLNAQANRRSDFVVHFFLKTVTFSDFIKRRS